MKRRTIDWMNRKAKRKMAKFAAAYGVSDRTAKLYGIPLRFIQAHRRWQRKLVLRQHSAEARLIY